VNHLVNIFVATHQAVYFVLLVARAQVAVVEVVAETVQAVRHIKP
jgi:hypothetical protein